MHDAVLQLARQAHALTEAAALSAPDAVQRKQFILADLSLHLVQAALRQPQPDSDELRRYLFSILTLSDGFVADLDLKVMADALLPASPAASQPATT
ncbi:hypothetical protein [Hymenobacter koreensis]|uniref:Uncharacterized protein n=1 Tax=Hymenobacter koreensis TaxID=1084523 RepID=A0ABP8JHA0_9BACT